MRLHHLARSGDATFLAPNFQDTGGTEAYVYFARAHMPLRIAVQTPLDAPRDGTPEDARKAVMAGILLWEKALETEIDWFQIEFAKDPQDARLRLTNLAAHEFGHILGLVYCWCDSIMAYSDSRCLPMAITELDLRTLLAPFEIPNGTRVDGRHCAPNGTCRSSRHFSGGPTT